MPPDPAVCHLMRVYARPSETFVVNQVSHHSRYRPVVLCHLQRADTPHPMSGVEPQVVCGVSPDNSRDALERSKMRQNLPVRGELKRALATVRKPDVAVLHAHYGIDAGVFLPLVLLAQRPLVVSYYGYDVAKAPDMYGGLGRPLLRSVFALGHAHLAMTPAMATDLLALGAPSDRVYVHHHGIDVASYSGIKPLPTHEAGPLRALMVAALVDKKGHEDLLEALTLLRRDGLELQVRLIGEGYMRKRVEELIQSNGLADSVTLLGHVPYGPELLGNYEWCDVFIHPSRLGRDGDREGLPAALLEAMAAARPVVSTTHAGIPYAVVDGQHGMLVSERDPGGLARCIRLLADDPALRQRLGSAARSRVCRLFAVDRQVARLEEIYDDLAHRRSYASMGVVP
jgi:colanic acid/amylovoran biosynthesis glycosyltransferase